MAKSSEPLTAGMSNADRLRTLRERAVAAGKCYTCRFRPVRPGARYCEECIARGVAHKKKVAQRKCQTCGADVTRRKTLLCGRCAKKAAARNRRRYDILVAFGVCTRCHVRDACDGSTQCTICLDDLRARQLARTRAAGVQPRECPICRDLGLPGTGHDSRTHDRDMARAAAPAG